MASGEVQIVTEHLDWTIDDHGLGKFDVVIACDVLYEREAIEPVANLAIKLMRNKGARFILADPESRTRAHRYSLIATPATSGCAKIHYLSVVLHCLAALHCLPPGYNPRHVALPCPPNTVQVKHASKPNLSWNEVLHITVRFHHTLC
jgi:hypothetical protein